MTISDHTVGSTLSTGDNLARRTRDDSSTVQLIRVLVAALGASVLTALVPLPRGSLAGAGFCCVVTLPATLLCCAAWQRLPRWIPAWIREGGRRVTFYGPHAFVGAAVFGVGAWAANLALVDAAFQSRALRAYLVVAAASALVIWRFGRRWRSAEFAQRPPSAIIAGLSALGLGLFDTHFYPQTYTRLHIPLLFATLALFSVATSAWLEQRKLRYEPWLALVCALGLLGCFLFSDLTKTYRGMLGSYTSQQRLLTGARWLFDRDRDGFAATLGGGDCNDHDRRAFPGSLKGRDCLGWAAQTTEVPGIEWPTPAAKGSTAPEVIVLLTIDAFRCGFGRAEPAPELLSACPELTRLASQGRLRLDAHTTYPRTDEAMGSLNTGSFRFDPAAPANRFFADWIEGAGYRTHAISTAGNQFPGKVQQSFQTVDLSLRSLGAAGTRADAVTDLILKSVAQREPGQPLFLWAHYFDAHAPYVDPPGSAWASGSDQKRYVAEIRRTDAAIGRLARALSAASDSENVVMFVTADHGEEFGDKGARYHGFSLTEEAVRIPMLVWAPSATAVAATPSELPVSIAEVSSYLAALVTGTPFRSRSEAFFADKTPANTSFGVYRAGWKLVNHRDFAFSELYDLGADPSESVNLEARRPDKRDELGGRLVSYVKLGDSPRAPVVDSAPE